MTRAHPHRQVNVHLDTIEDADIIEHIEMQPSMVGYIRELVRRDMYDERLDYAALKTSELQVENAKLRELCKAYYKFAYEIFDECFGEPELDDEFMALEGRMRELGVRMDG